MYLLRCVAVSCLGVVALSGCATVSMVSGQAMVETGLLKQASSVEQVCEAYVAKAEAEAWVKPSTGLFGFARTLVTGDQTDSDVEASPYLQRIEFDTSPVGDIMTRLTNDVGRAGSGLSIVTEEAAASLSEPEQTPEMLKAHVISFESALITAQKSRRTFITAFEALSEREGNLDAAEFDTALVEFDATIDAARLTADKLASAYSTLAMSHDVGDTA